MVMDWFYSAFAWLFYRPQSLVERRFDIIEQRLNALTETQKDLLELVRDVITTMEVRCGCDVDLDD